MCSVPATEIFLNTMSSEYHFTKRVHFLVNSLIESVTCLILTGCLIYDEWILYLFQINYK